MDLCHFKNTELEKFHKYKGRGDVVKADSALYAVFTEQGSAASHMTATKFLDVVSRILGCAGRPSDAVSACTQAI